MHTRSKGLWHGRSPRISIGHQLAGSPDLSGEVDSRLINLDKLERRLVRIFAVSAAVGDVGQDRADVVRPLSPLEFDGSACSDSRRDICVDCILVAGDVWVSVSVSLHLGGHDRHTGIQLEDRKSVV